MATAEELIVKINAQGADETQDSIEGVEESMQDTTDSVENQADALQGFSEEFKGALGAAVAGLAVGVAGLASQVPIVGELFAGLGAILEAVGLQIDQLVRDLGAGGLTSSLFEIAAGINEADGVAGDLVGALGLLAGTVGSAITAFLGYKFAIGGIPAVLGSIKAGALAVGGAIKTTGATIASLVSGSLAAAAALGALLGTFTVGILEVTGINDKIRDLGELVGSMIPQSVADLITVFTGGITTIGAAILGFVEGTLEGGLSEGIDQAIERSKEALDNFKQAWKRTLGRIKEFINKFLNKVGIDSLGSLGVNLSGPGGGDNTSSSSGQLAGKISGNGGTTINMDGRELTEQTGRFRFDNSVIRGL